MPNWFAIQIPTVVNLKSKKLLEFETETYRQNVSEIFNLGLDWEWLVPEISQTS